AVRTAASEQSLTGGAGVPDSNAPMSAAAPIARGKPEPRWSKKRPTAGRPASMATLPDASACVHVGPPWSASGSRPGSAAIVSGGAAGDELMTMLWSPVIGGVGPAMLNRVMSWPLLLAVLLATMLLAICSE